MLSTRQKIVKRITNVKDKNDKIYDTNKKIAKVTNKIITNSNYKKGLTSSIQQGVDAADDQTHGFIICLGDMVGIKGLDYIKLAEYHLLNTHEDELITLPKVGDKTGNPVIFSQSFRSRIMHHDDPEGCKLIVKTARHSVQYFKSNRHQFLQDIDTWDDYHRLSER